MSLTVTFAAVRTTETTPRVLVLSTPSSTNWNLGIQEQIYNQMNAQGELAFDESMVQQKQPVVTLQYQKLRQEHIALKLGFKLENQAITDALFTGTRRLTKGAYAAAATGQEGNGMVADQTTSQCFVLQDGLSVALTRQPFATFNAATANSFAQGANGAMKFSDDLVAARAWVTPYFFYPVADANVLTEDPFTNFDLTLRGVHQEEGVKRVFQIQFPFVEINRQESGQFDFGAEQQTLAFRVTDSECVPRLRFLNLATKC